MIKEDYCSFEIAKLLKEKGFNVPTHAFYNPKKNYTLKFDTCLIDRNAGIYVSAPTHQMAMAWLREYKIYIMIDRSWSMKDSWQYCICVNNDFDNLIQQDSIPNRTYEEAVEAALKYVLENLI